MTTRVKICGVTSEADLAAAVNAGADAVGFLVDVPVDSPREIDTERATALVEAVPPFVTSVLVTMPSAVQPAVRLQDRVGADAIQVHGTLAPEYVAGLGDRVDASVIAAVDAATESAPDYAAAADALLVDSTDASGGGGTGETHDWDRARELATEIDVPLVLAGGLTPANVGEAVAAVDPFAVDTATGVEANGGEKDHGAVRAFVQNAATTEVSA